jgi:hypothetical protein
MYLRNVVGQVHSDVPVCALSSILVLVQPERNKDQVHSDVLVCAQQKQANRAEELSPKQNK